MHPDIRWSAAPLEGFNARRYCIYHPCSTEPCFYGDGYCMCPPHPPHPIRQFLGMRDPVAANFPDYAAGEQHHPSSRTLAPTPRLLAAMAFLFSTSRLSNIPMQFLHLASHTTLYRAAHAPQLMRFKPGTRPFWQG